MTRDAGRLLADALLACFSGFGGKAAIEGLASHPWASITFSGARHRLTLVLEGPGAGAAGGTFLAGLAEREFDLRGHVVADIALLGDAVGIEPEQARLPLEALTIVAA